MSGVSQQSQYCLEAWISCENLLANLAMSHPPALPNMAKTVDECAHICMETWQALKSHTQEIKKLVLLCIGICEECAELCEQHNNPQMQQCAKACRNCANSFIQLAIASAYN